MIRILAFLLYLLPSLVGAQQTITFRTVWHTPLHPNKATKAEFEEGVRQGFAEFTKHYNVNFVERFGPPGTQAQIYVISFPLCHNAGALWAERPFSCYPWRAIYYNSNDSRRWGVFNCKTILMHEVLHVLEYNGKNFHSTDTSCVSHINGNQAVFCPAEDAWLARRFGRRPQPPPPPPPPPVKPRASIDRITRYEGHSGHTPFTFTITLDRAVPRTIKVRAFTSDGTATLADSDYIRFDSDITFAANQTTREVTVNVIGDTKPEPDEHFFIHIASQDADIATPFGLGIILNDDFASPLITESFFVDGGPGNQSFWQYRVMEPVQVALIINNVVQGNRHVERAGVWMFAAPQSGVLRIEANNGQRATFVGRNYGMD